MVRQPLPTSLRRVIEKLEAEPGRQWRLDDLAATCGVAPRTLQKHFRRFLGQSARAFLQELRFNRARQALLVGGRRVSVTDVAARCGFTHLGRFAAAYLRRYGESPSTTLRRCQRKSAQPAQSPLVLTAVLERPTIAVLPFERIGPQPYTVGAFVDEIGAALGHLRWLKVGEPRHARYHLRGSVRGSNGAALRIMLRLLDASNGNHLWAAAWDSDGYDPVAFEERLATAVTRAIQPAVRAAEAERASRLEVTDLTAWELTMRALPCVASTEAAAAGRALELLERAIELAPHDPLPMSIASWCHGLRAGHHFTARPEIERAAARELASRAGRLNIGDPLAETMLAAGCTLAHDLDAAAVHADRALALDGSCAWAWGRSAWIKAYAGRAEEAMEEFHIARALAPADMLNFLWFVGIGATEFQLGHYGNTIRWYDHALAENPACTWNARFLAPACVLAGRKDEGRRVFGDLRAVYPDLTIAEVRSGLPWNASYTDRICEGLERLGMAA
jgi:AraC-like DNA-binding protein/tetratricopeptide (TPR) repeat protein